MHYFESLNQNIYKAFTYRMNLSPFVFLELDEALLVHFFFCLSCLVFHPFLTMITVRKLWSAVVLPQHVTKQLITKPFLLMLKANHLEKSVNLMNNLGVILRIALIKLPPSFCSTLIKKAYQLTCWEAWLINSQKLCFFPNWLNISAL